MHALGLIGDGETAFQMGGSRRAEPVSGWATICLNRLGWEREGGSEGGREDESVTKRKIGVRWEWGGWEVVVGGGGVQAHNVAAKQSK